MAGGRSKRDLAVFVILVIFTLFLLKFQLYDVEQTRGQNGHSGPVLDQLDEYCNKPHKVKGHDGHLDSSGFSLEAVTILLRHGDRTPMAEDNSTSVICHVSRQVNQLVSKYWSCLDPIAIELLKSLTSSLRCGLSQLTTIGIEQHLRLGKFLRTKYRKLFSKEALLRSTNYSRSVLSVLSLLSEFGPGWCVDQKPHLAISKSVYFMTQECPAISLLKESAPKITVDDWPPDLAFIRHIFEQPDTEEDNWTTKKNPESVADFVATKYCHNGVLPKLCHAEDDLRGRESHCVTHSTWAQFFSVVDHLFAQRMEHVDSQRAYFLESYELFERVLNGTHRLAIFSGHDVTIESVLSTLGLLMTHHVPYASRLVLEKWRKSSKDFLRILLNGEPVKISGYTNGKDALVPFDQLVEYLHRRQRDLFLIDGLFDPAVFDTI